MDELEALEEKIFGAMRTQKLRPTLIGLFGLTGVAQADLRRWCQLKVDGLITEFLPQMEIPWYLPASKVEPWLREQAEKLVGQFIDKYFNSK